MDGKPATGPVRLERDDEIALAVLDHPPVNALSAAVRDGLRDALVAVAGDPSLAALVLIGAGDNFVAGGDIGALGSRPGGATMREINRLIEDSAKPVIAALQGAAMGGGLEMTLAAHGRNAARTLRCGLPEVKLGILPGAGGTQRLPRLVGFARALELVAIGETLGADEALAIGLVDRVVEATELRAAAIGFAREMLARPAPPRVRDRTAEIDRARAEPRLFHDFEARHARRLRLDAAAQASVRAVRAATELPFEEGLTFERSLFEGLVHTEQSKALRHLFFAEREAWKVPGLGRDSVAPALRRICILVANREGEAVARAFRAAGLDVAFWEREPAALAAADLVFDPTCAGLPEQRALIARAAPQMREGALLSTGAAGGVADLAPAATTLGIHFLPPTDAKKFVELIRPAAASPIAVLSVLRLLKRMGKTAILVAPARATGWQGQVAARLMAARQRAADILVAENLATPWQIDVALDGFGFAEGVFAWQDRVGVQTGWLATGAAGDGLRDRLAIAGRTGQDAGAGFHNYSAGAQRLGTETVQRLGTETAQRDGTEFAPRRSADAERLLGLAPAVPMAAASLLAAALLPIANEGLELLREGVALRASDIDLAAVTAHGWPDLRGGPLFWLEHAFGAALALAWLEHLQARFGDFYRPSPLLRDLASGRLALGMFRREAA